MNSNEKIASYKLSKLFEIYKVYFGYFSIRGCLTDLNFKFISNSNEGLHDLMDSNEKVVNYKV
jgi:hypothetical protein